MQSQKEKSPLSFQSLVEDVVARYNDKENTPQISIVNYLETPWCADPTFKKIERSFFVAPDKDEFRAEVLNNIIYQIEMIFGEQAFDCGYFFYFYNRLALASLHVAQEDGKFRYKYNNLISLLPESVESWNQLLFFPSIALAEYFYQNEISADPDQRINASFDLLRDFGFVPQIHLSEEEMAWHQKKLEKDQKQSTVLLLFQKEC